MRTALNFAFRDLRGGLSGLGLLWVCLAVAVAGIASVTSLASSIDSAIAANGRQLLGGDLILTVAQREATADERAAMEGLQSLTTVEQAARERGVEPASIGYRSRAKSKEAVSA